MSSPEITTLLETLGIAKTSGGAPIGNLSNAVKVLESHPEFKDMVWFDEFYQKVFTKWRTSKPREWSDADDLALTQTFQGDFGFQRISVEVIGQAIRLHSIQRTRNEPRDWMDKLVWDRKPRVEKSLVTYFGAKDSEYARRVGQNFWVSMAARIFNPGCQVDTMVVLEGEQGIGKSQALRMIGGPWYAEASESVTNKDFFMILPGKLIVEIAELDSFNRAETTRIKQVISCPSDRYRAPYAHSAQDYPRMSVFVGSTNEHEYLKDNTGARRFWPVECGRIKPAMIEEDREQLFAEAVYLQAQGLTWWEVPAEAARAIQEERRNADPWEEKIREYLIGKSETTYLEVVAEAIGMKTEHQHHGVQKRVGNVMRKLGWEKGRKRISPDSLKKTIWMPKSEWGIQDTLNLQNDQSDTLQ